MSTPVTTRAGTTAGERTAPATGAVPEERAAEYRRRGWWREETFLGDLHRQAALRPRRLAVAGRRVAESRTDTLDYAELNRLTDRFALALLELGVRPGDFVAVQLPNRWEMVPLIFASIRVGAVIIPISPICTEEELRHRLGLTGARVCVTLPTWADTPLAEIVTRLQGELPSLEHVLVVDGPVPEGALPFHEHFVAEEREEHEGAAARLDGLALGADDPFVVLFTSGTTGLSKGVLHSQNTVHSAVRGYVDAFGAGDDWVAAVSTPWSTTRGSHRVSSPASCWAGRSPSRTYAATRRCSTWSSGTERPSCTDRPPHSPTSPRPSGPSGATRARCGTW